MIIVTDNRKRSYENMEVLLCHFHLHVHYVCVGATERYWSPWFASVPCLSDRYFEPASFYAVPTVCRIAKSNGNSILLSIPFCDGATGMNKRVSTVWTISRVPEGRRLFPPQQQHNIMALATQPPRQEGHPITQWSINDLTRAVVAKGLVESIGPATIWRLLDQAAIKPHRWHYWLNSPDKEFDRKMLDVVTLYMNALKMYKAGEIVLSVDEKTSIQALERRYPTIEGGAGSIARIEYEYIRHGTCCLTAGFEVATGSVMGMLTANRPAEVFAEFIGWVCDYYDDARKIHIVMDNLNTHYHELTCQVIAEACKLKLDYLKTGVQRKTFLTDTSKRVISHFTPSHASWLNQIEIWFSQLTGKVIRRGDFSSISDLEDKIIEFIAYYNTYLAKAYNWTYTGKPLAADRKAA